MKQKIREIKEMDLVSFLESLGYQPAKIRGNEFWYLSPLRDEKTASFKVDRKLNAWFDHGLGKGGNLIDFAILHDGCTVGEFLSKMLSSSFHPLPRKEIKLNEAPGKKIEVISDKSLRKYPLLKYLRERRIDLEVADKYCREVTFRIGEKEYYGIGFKNDSDGWDIRNPYMKSASLPKDITTFSNSHQTVNIFEGFFDFLSHQTLFKNQPLAQQDFVILNTLGMFEKARPFIEKHPVRNLFLDNDTGGQNFTLYALSLHTAYQDMRHLYRNHKDYNDWLKEFGKPVKMRANQKL